MNTLLGRTFKPVPYQEGGRVSPALAQLRRLRSRREAAQYAQEQLDKANKKAGRSKLFGSVGGLAGGLLLPAIAGALGVSTGGLAIPLIAGLGTGLGAFGGKKLGYGDDVDIDEDMRYGGSEFLGEAGLDRQASAQDDFTGSFARDSALQGLMSAITAGMSKGGGLSGKAARFGQGLTDKGATGAALIPSYAQSFAMDTGLDTASNAGSVLDVSGVGDLTSGVNPVQSGFNQPLLPAMTVTRLSDYGSVSEAIQSPVFDSAEAQFLASAPEGAYSSGNLGQAIFDADILPDQPVNNFNFADEFEDLVYNTELLRLSSPEGRESLGLPQANYFQDLLKDSRSKMKQNLFPQNNVLSMLGNQ